MTYHIVLPRPIDLPLISEEAKLHYRPRHSMWLLAQKLNAHIHQPEGLTIALDDQVRAKIIGSPESWALARALATQVDANDCIFCLSEEGGLQVAAICGAQRDRPKIALFVHNLSRPRGRLALKLWQIADRVDLFLACSQIQVNFLRQYLGLPASKVKFIWDHTDTKFFSPGALPRQNSRPQIVSVGLEQRDYRTLATATANLDVDVKISGFSKDASVLSKTFPKSLPANMHRQFYPWPELVQLYQTADVVVVSLHENRYAAGVQALMEAMACGCAIVVTATEGLKSYLDAGSVLSIQPGDSEAMQRAILQCLNDPEEAAVRAQRGYQIAQERYQMERYVQEIAEELQSLQPSLLISGASR